MDVSFPSPTVRGQIPEFHHFDPLKFQQLCCELHQKEPNISTAEVFGLNGQAQYGADIVAFLRTNDGIEVGQCKRVTRCTPSLIKSASDDFLAHLAFWRNRAARKFILYVACSTSDRKVQEEIATQKKCFGDIGFEYEAWSNLTLTTKLRTAPEIVRTYFPKHWENEICGERISFPSGRGSVIEIAAYAELAESLAEYLSGEADEELEKMREAWREGRPSEMRATIAKLRTPARWRVLPDKVKAKALRFQAQLDLENGHVEAAKNLVAEASAFDPTENRRTEALVQRALGNLDKALAVLEGSSDLDSRILHAALLLEKGEIEQSVRVLEQVRDHAEAYRLLALASFLQRDMPRARLEIEKAYSLKPRWRSVVYARSVICYFAGLAECVLPFNLPQWPEPVEWGLIKLDDESREVVQSAARGFAELAEASEIREEERRLYEIWNLACLANDPEKRSEAEAYCQKILSADPGHYAIVPWVLARRFQVDLGPPIQLLKDRASKDQISPVETIVLCIWHAQNQNVPAAVELLDEKQELFEKGDSSPLWRLWRTQLDILSEKPPLEEEVSSTADDIRDELRLVSVRSLAARTGNTAPLVDELKRHAHTQGVRLFELCSILAEQEQWRETAEFAPALLERVGTAEALSLACVCLYNNHEYARCLELLDQHRHFYPYSELPNEMLRLRVAAQRALGTLPEAALHAQELFQREPSKINFLILGDLYFEKGDFKSLAILLRKHREYSDLEPKSLIRMAMRILDEDPALAADLWRRAAQIGFADDEVTAALDVGYKLKLDNELRPLVERLSVLANDPNAHVRQSTLDETIELLRKHYGEAHRLHRLYREGQVAIHMISGPARWPLVIPYHRLPQINEREGSAAATLIRHGSRVGSRLPTAQHSLRLHADLTALFTAIHLGALKEIEDLFRPILLPHDTLIALTLVRNEVKPPQPARITSLRAIESLVHQNKINVLEMWLGAELDSTELNIDSVSARLISFAAKNGATFATSLPLLGNDGSTLSQLTSSHEALIRDGHCIINSLLWLGEISEEEHSRAFASMGVRPITPSQEEIKAGSVILCRSYILEMLAAANILGCAAKVFRLGIDAEEFQQMVMAQLNSLETANSDAVWLADVAAHISNGIESGSYSLMPDLTHVQEDMSRLNSDEDPIMKSLMDLLTFSPFPGDAIWVDDRWFNSYAHRDGVPVIDTMDLLYALMTAGRINDEKFFAILHRARESKLRYIALDENEIVTAVRKAPLANDELVETSVLRAMRRYYAECLRDGETLYVIPSTERLGNSNAFEWPFMLASGHAVISATLRVWRETNGNYDVARAQSEWILSNLYSPDHGRSLTAAQRRQDLDLQMEGSALSAFLVRAISFLVTDTSEREARRAYLQWIYWRLIQPRFTADPLLATLTLDNVKRVLGTSIDAVDDSIKHRKAALAVAGAFFADLPDELRQELAKDGTFLQKIGASQRELLRIEKHSVSAEFLWKAAASAVKAGGTTTVKTEDGAELELQIDSSGERRKLLIVDRKENFAGVLLEEAVNVLADSATDRENALRSVRHWFDREVSDANKLIATITVIDDHTKRMSELIQVRRISAENYYRELYGKIRARQSLFPADLIPPDISSILRHLRLPEDAQGSVDFAESLNAAAKHLIDDIGLQPALIRLFGLPVALPIFAMEALATLQVSARSQLIKNLLPSATASPLATAHCAKILMQFRNDKPSYITLVRRLLRRNLQSREYVETWLSVLHRCSEDLCFNEAFRKMSHTSRFTILWAHADRLYRILCNSGLPIDWIRDNIGEGGLHLPAEVVFGDANYTADVAYPRRLAAPIFGLATAAYVLADADDALRTIISEMIGQNHTLLALLVRDQSRAPNALCSFLVPTARWFELLPEPARTDFAPASVRGMLKPAVEQLLSTTSDSSPWAWIHAVLGDLPPPTEIEEELRKAILSTDFKKLYEGTPDHRLAPIIVASAQAPHLGAEVAGYLRKQLIILGAHLNNAEAGGHVEEETAIICFLPHLMLPVRYKAPPANLLNWLP